MNTMRSAAIAVIVSCVLVLPIPPIASLERYIELTQMLSVAVGTEVPISDRSGIRAGIGWSPLGVTGFTYSLTAAHRLRPRQSAFQLDIELGMPLAYFDLIEGRYVDRDPHIESPYAGWLFGGDLVLGFRRSAAVAPAGYRPRYRQWSLVTGYAAWWEWQESNGWKGPGGMIHLALRFGWGRR